MMEMSNANFLMDLAKRLMKVADPNVDQYDAERCSVIAKELGWENHTNAVLKERTLEELAYETEDAYSFDAFGHEEWLATIEALFDEGYNEEQIEAIMRSKITRWARDSYSEFDEGKAEYVINFINDPRNKITPEQINSWI